MSHESWGTVVRAPDCPSRGLGSKYVICLELTNPTGGDYYGQSTFTERPPVIQ